MDGGSGAAQAPTATLRSAFAAQANVGTEWTNAADYSEEEEWRRQHEGLQHASTRNLGRRGSTRQRDAFGHGSTFTQEGKYSSEMKRTGVSEELLGRLETGESRARKSRLARSTSAKHMGGGRPGPHRAASAPYEHKAGALAQGNWERGAERRKYKSSVSKPSTNQVEVPKLQLENLGGGPSSTSLSQYSGTVSNKAKHRQKFGGMARAYSEKLTNVHLRGVDALYWNDIDEEAPDAGKASNFTLDDRRLQVESMKSLGGRLGHSRHGKNHNSVLHRTRSVDPDILRNTRGGVSRSRLLAEGRNPGGPTPVLEQARSLPWHGVGNWGENKEWSQQEIGLDEARMRGEDPVGSSKITQDVLRPRSEPRKQRLRTPLDIPRLRKVYSNPRDNLASLAPLEAWSYGSHSSAVHDLHRTPNGVYRNRERSENEGSLHQSVSMQDLNRLRGKKRTENFNSESEPRGESHQPLRTALSLQSAVTLGEIENEPLEHLSEELSTFITESFEEIRRTPNVDLSMHLNQEQNLSRVESISNFFGVPKSGEPTEHRASRDDVERDSISLAITMDEPENDGEPSQNSGSSALSLKRMASSQISFAIPSPPSHNTSPFVQLNAANQV